MTNDEGHGDLYDFTSGAYLRPALAVEASCWATLRRSGVSHMLVAADEVVARHSDCEVAVVWKLGAPRGGEE